MFFYLQIIFCFFSFYYILLHFFLFEITSHIYLYLFFKVSFFYFTFLTFLKFYYPYNQLFHNFLMFNSSFSSNNFSITYSYILKFSIFIAVIQFFFYDFIYLARFIYLLSFSLFKFELWKIVFQT